jgi:hypothetical protein
MIQNLVFNEYIKSYDLRNNKREVFLILGIVRFDDYQ